jgi:uncharacterized protein YggT (Ycf19 family)
LNTQIIYFIANLVSILLYVLEVAMLLRAILSWIVMMTEGAGSRLYGFLMLITEPIVWPFRKIFDFFGWGEDMPVDLPFMAAYLAIVLVGLLL